MNIGNTVDFTGDVMEVRTNPSDSEEDSSSERTDPTHKIDDDLESQKNRTKKDPNNTNNTASVAAKEGKVTVVTAEELEMNYEGDTLDEKLKELIDTHSIVMFQKTWCLFSMDAQTFLTHQLGCDVWVIEVDVHPQGKDISVFIYERTNGHSTVPAIFIKGEFLGGFDSVNSLYATGKLQSQYLVGISQADACEDYLAKRSDLSSQPLFWFPETVNAHVVRASGMMTSLAAAVSTIVTPFEMVWGRYIAYALFFDFVLRLFGGSKWSVIGNISTLITSPLEPKPRHGRPKQFATMCGMLFAALGSLMFLIPFEYHDYVAMVFMGGLAIACGMEGFLDFCVGCTIFKWGIKLGIIRK